MKIRLIGQDPERLPRMQKRLRCAASGLCIPTRIEVEPDDLRALGLGARQGPIAVARASDGQLHTLMDGLEPVERVQTRLQRWFADRRDPAAPSSPSCGAETTDPPPGGGDHPL